jgi:RNase P/RNase MRP subunit p30
MIINESCCTKIQAEYAATIARDAHDKFIDLLEKYPNQMMENAVMSISSQIFLNIAFNMLQKNNADDREIVKTLRSLNKQAFQWNKKLIKYMIENLEK